MIEAVSFIKVFLIALWSAFIGIGMRLWDEMHGNLHVLPGFGI